MPHAAAPCLIESDTLSVREPMSLRTLRVHESTVDLYMCYFLTVYFPEGVCSGISVFRADGQEFFNLGTWIAVV